MDLNMEKCTEGHALGGFEYTRTFV